MNQTKHILRPLLMAIVMLVGMLVPQGAWAENLSVGGGETKTIKEDENYTGVTVEKNGTLIIKDDGQIILDGELNVSGTVIIEKGGQIIVDGELNVSGTVIIEKDGQIINQHHDGGSLSVNVNEGGKIINYGELLCTSTYIDYGGIFDNHGSYNDGGFIENNGTFYDNETVEISGITLCPVCGRMEGLEQPDQENDTYLIANASNLYWFADHMNNDEGYRQETKARLVADIMLNDGTFDGDGNYKPNDPNAPNIPLVWKSIGSDVAVQGNSFCGTFDGNGYTISGLYVNDNDGFGLFKDLDEGASVVNLGLVNCYINPDNETGAICRYNNKYKNCTISNCYATGVVSRGLCQDNHGTISNCYTIDPRDSWKGHGICEYNYGTISNCYTSQETAIYDNCGNGTSSEVYAYIPAERFASGEIAYKLNEGKCDGTQKWYQKLGENGDSHPVLAAAVGNTVYAGYENCASVELSYSNANTLYATKEEAPHRWNDGICDICGGYQQPEGEGTEQSPYLIANKGNILWFNNSNSLANAQVKLVADVAITKAISVGSGKELTMNLDGHVLTGGEGIDIFDITGGTLNLRDAESNAGKLTKGKHGLMITDGGTFNMYGGGITECTSQGSAGAAVNVNDGTFNMFGGAITDNQNDVTTSTCYYRGVVYVHPINGYFNMQGGSITSNSGDTYGTGVYCVAEADGSEPTDHDGCLAAGTLVTMADGSKKAIEAVAIGESVLTMNHDTGEMTAEPVFFVHKTEMGDAFTLHFSNGTNVTAVKDHSFFEKADNRYVTLNPQNASSYVGRSFYCAETNAWVELTAVTPVEGTVGTYALLVAHTLNHLADGMLSANEPTFPVYNAFEFGDNLTIDPVKKAADIALYGTLDYEAVKDVVSREFFDALNGQYAPVLFGKGMASMENLLRMAASYLTPNNAKQGARRRAGEEKKYHVTLSGKVIISGNTMTSAEVESGPSNLAVSEGMLSIGTLEAGSMIGIDLCISDKESESSNKITDRVYGVVASDAVEGDVQYFTADNPLAGITYNDGKLAIHLHSFTNKTLTAEPVADGLYAYACDVDGCGGHTDDHIVKNGEGENTTIIELTDDGEGNFSAASVDVADGQTFQTPVEFTAPSDKVTVARTFTASKPATVMLPFTIDASLVQGATFSEFGGVSYDAEKAQWVATMTSVTTGNLQAYKPYIVILDAGNTTGKVTFGNNTSADVATFVVTPDASAMQTADENGWTFQAVNAAKTWAEGDKEIGKAYGFAGKDKTVDGNDIHQGDFVKIAAGASAKPGRCYLVKDGALSGASNAPARAAAEELPATIAVRFINGETLGIGTLNTDTGEFSIDGWYDLQGNRIEQPTKGGINIHNNKKILVK